MKKLKDLILEKLRINKDTEPYYDKFVFKPKESDANAKEISDLTVYLPFEILVNNKRKITIAKIQHEFDTKYKFDAWDLYDNNDKQIFGLTNYGIINLLLMDDGFDIELKGESKTSSIITIKNSLNIVKESYLNEKLKINKETNFDLQINWEDEDKFTKYTYDAIYYVFNLIKDKINWDKCITSISEFTFDETTLSANDLEELHKKLKKDNIERTGFYLNYNEWQYDFNKKSYFRVSIFKTKLIDIHNSLMHKDKYDLTIYNEAKNFYKKYYKDICKQ